MTGNVRPTFAARLDLPSALVAMLVTFVSWQVLSRAATSLLVNARQPEAALAFRPADGPGLSSLALTVMSRRPGQKAAADEVRSANAQSVKRLTDRALVGTPLDTSALQLRAQSFEMLGDVNRAKAIMTAAGAQTLRDTVVDLYLINQDVAAKDYNGALMRADALLRVSPDAATAVYPQLVALAPQSETHRAFIATLGSGPPWRAGFLTSLATKIEDPTSFLDVMLALRTSPSPLTDVELRAFLDPLIERGLVDQAYYVWLQFLPGKRIETLPYLYNGDFVYKLTNLPFDWTVIPIDGAKTTFEPIEGQDERKLFVQFEGKRVPYMSVVQMLVLPPGKYRLSGLYRTDGLNNPRGTTWRIYCAQRNDSIPIAETERVSGTSDGWKDFATTFDVPTDACGAQWLRLELAARVAIEEMASGSVSYRDLKIDRADGKSDRTNEPAITMPAQPGTAFERAIRGR